MKTEFEVLCFDVMVFFIGKMVPNSNIATKVDTYLLSIIKAGLGDDLRH